MSTASTRSSRNSRRHGTGAHGKRRAHGRQGDASASPQPGAAGPPEISERVWHIAHLAILACAAALRFYHLDLKPLHHDEGINGNFLAGLFRAGHYHYDPANYHGPTLYYFALPFAYLLGLNTFAIRSVTALFGLLTVWLILRLRRDIGTFGALAAAALVAVSPGAVFFSRDFIHETLVTCFSLGVVAAALRYHRTGRPRCLLLASASAALLFATKETAVVFMSVFAIAAATALSLRPKHPDPVRSVQEQVRRQHPTVWVMGASALFLGVSILFYSSFFTDPNGIQGALKSLALWTVTGGKTQGHPWNEYVLWLWREEAPILVLGTAGAWLAVRRTGPRFAVFSALWAFGLLAAYSFVPYKTPWIVLNFIVPLAITAGCGLTVVQKTGGPRLATALLLAALAVCSFQSVTLNFQHYDDDRSPYVYVHTQREFLSLIGQIDRLAAASGTGADTDITVTSPDYWPMPWYLRDYRHVGYFGRVVPVRGAAIIVGSKAQEAELRASYGTRYEQAGSYPLRPGVTLLLYVRRDLIRR